MRPKWSILLTKVKMGIPRSLQTRNNFFCLRFDAFGDVDEHDGTVGCHQRPVRVFTEVLMARRIEDVDVMAS